jgi:hypothetical protein
VDWIHLNQNRDQMQADVNTETLQLHKRWVLEYLSSYQLHKKNCGYMTG